MIHACIFVLWCGWGYFGCGALVTWRLRRWGISGQATAVLLSFVILFAAALLLQCLAIPLSRTNWCVATFALSGMLCLVPRFAGLDLPYSTGVSNQPRMSNILRMILWSSVGIAGLAIAYRAIAHPLTGFDTAFRWDFLARQIIRTGDFGFYPPVTESDFTHYMWPESIPPLVSLLYAWGYLCAGTLVPATTAAVVLLIAILVFRLTWLLATNLAGCVAGLWACALLSASAVHTWSISMGQEMGVLTAGVLTTVWALSPGHHRVQPDWFLAGIGAGVVCLSRSYGGAAILVGFFALAVLHRPWGERNGFIAVSLAISVPWYLRTWWATGNPLYNHDLFGLFPINKMHAGLMRFYENDLGFLANLFDRLEQMSHLMWSLGPALLIAGMASLIRWRTWSLAMRFTVAVWIALWVWSVGFTAGGMSYSLRVLCPVLVLLAVGGGNCLARWVPPRPGLAAAIVVLLLAVEASIRSLLGLTAPSAVPARSWLTASKTQSAPRGGNVEDRLARYIGSDGVLVQSAYEHAFLAARGVLVAPPWSPGLEFLAARDVDMPTALEGLRKAGFGYVLVSTSADLEEYFGQHEFFRKLPRWSRPMLSDPHWILLKLNDSAQSR